MSPASRRWETGTNTGSAVSSSGDTIIAERNITSLAGHLSLNSGPADLTNRSHIGTQPLYYILKSDNERDIETSMAHGIWCCGMSTNKKLSNRFNSTDAPVFLIFSVNTRSAINCLSRDNSFTNKLLVGNFVVLPE